MILLDRYFAQRGRLPLTGRHILAHYDATTIVVYQAYKRSIGLGAALDGRFGQEWSRTRMSWIKTSFLWMMHRCGWATKQNQEIVLAIRIMRSGFDEMLRCAVSSLFDPEAYSNRDMWSAEVAMSDVRLQWDPDRDPLGMPLERRAIQLGLRRGVLNRFADEWIVGIEDITSLVREQHARVIAGNLGELELPREVLYPVSCPMIAKRLGMDVELCA